MHWILLNIFNPVGFIYSFIKNESLAMMILRIYHSLLAILLSTATLVYATNFDEMKDSVFEHFSLIYSEGKNEIHMPFYTYHFPYAYDRENLDQLNQWPIGLGYGKGLNKDDGRWSGFYFVSFIIDIYYQFTTNIPPKILFASIILFFFIRYYNF